MNINHTTLELWRKKWSETKNIRKNAVTAIATVAVFVLMCRGFNFLYNDDRYSKERVWWHRYYENQDNIDNLFIGSSHVYQDINPMLLDGLNGKNNYNMGAGGARMHTPYYMLREALSEHAVSHVYLEVYYDMSSGDDGDLDDFYNRSNGWRATDYMEWSFGKLKSMWDIGGIERGLETWLPFIRYRTGLFDIEYIKDVVNFKRSENYLNYIYNINREDGSKEEIKDKGYMSNNSVLQPEKILYKRSVLLSEMNGLTSSAEQYLRKIITYCQNRDVEITLIVSPVYELQVLADGDYDYYYRQIKNIAAEYGVSYYDFNLCGTEYLDIQDRQYFTDPGHLNDAGADLYTALLWEVLSGVPEENKKYFFDSYKEKLRAEEPRLFGVYYDVVTDDVSGEMSRSFYVASNREEGMEYRIIVTPEEGQQYMIQDFSVNKEFAVEEGHGVITVVARLKESPEDVQTVEVDF